VKKIAVLWAVTLHRQGLFEVPDDFDKSNIYAVEDLLKDDVGGLLGKEVTVLEIYTLPATDAE